MSAAPSADPPGTPAIEGRAHVYGDRIDTDLLAPGHALKKSPEEAARCTLEAVDPGFAARVAPGDVFVAGRDLGIGSSREQAALHLKTLGVAAVLAKSFARIFYRNCINAGLPAFVLPPEIEIEPGERLRLDMAQGRLDRLDRGEAAALQPMPAHLRAMIDAGGLMASLKQRLAAPPQPGAS